MKYSYDIGEKTWFRGNEVTITSDPFIYCGGEFQNAVTETGKVLMVATPKQTESNRRRNQDDWSRQQEGFRRLRGESV